MDVTLLGRTARCWVDRQRLDSDHFPVVLDIVVPGMHSAPAIRPGEGGEPLPRVVWDSAWAPSYVSALRSQTAHLTRCSRLVARGQLQEAFQSLSETLITAATDAGCKQSCNTGGRTYRHRDKPYFDSECCSMRAEFRRVSKADPETGHVLARRYITVLGRKCRQHRQRQTPAMLRQLRCNDKSFWKRFNTHHSGLPAPLAAHPSWEQYHARLAAPPARICNSSVPAPPQTAPPPGQLD